MSQQGSAGGAGTFASWGAVAGGNDNSIPRFNPNAYRKAPASVGMRGPSSGTGTGTGKSAASSTGKPGQQTEEKPQGEDREHLLTFDTWGSPAARPDKPGWFPFSSRRCRTLSPSAIQTGYG